MSTVNAEHRTLNVFTVRYPQTQQETSQHELLLPGIFLESPPAHRSTVAQSFFGAVLLNTPLAHTTSPCLEIGNNQWAKSMPLSLQERERPFQDTQSKRNGSLELVEYIGYTFPCSLCLKGHQGTPMVSLTVNMPHSVVTAYSTLLHGVS